MRVSLFVGVVASLWVVRHLWQQRRASQVSAEWLDENYRRGLYELAEERSRPWVSAHVEPSRFQGGWYTRAMK